MPQTLTHSDECSGTSILDDGTKVFWSEGYSDTVVVYPDGKTERVWWEDRKRHPIVSSPAAMDIHEDCRQMTPDEEKEHDSHLRPE